MTNISRSRCNQRVKFGQLKEHKMRNIFLEKSNSKCCRETIPRLFPKKSKLSISLDQLCKVLNSLFLLYGNLWTIEIYWNEAADHLFLPHIKLFKKIKGGLELVFVPHFLYDFWRKIIYLVILYYLTKFHCLVAFTL